MRSRRRIDRARVAGVLLLALAAAILPACTREKAQALQAAVLQFKNEAFKAIGAIETMYRRELEPMPRPEEEVLREAVSGILSVEVDELEEFIIDLALDPYTVDLDPAVEEEWQAFAAQLRASYAGFASIFDSLDGASSMARSEVRESRQYAEKLTLQLAAIAAAIDRDPPRLLQYHGALMARLEDLRESYARLADRLEQAGGVDAGIESQIEQVESETGQALLAWKMMRADEDELRRATMEQCMKAATLGYQVRKLIQDYDTLDLAVIAAVVPRIIDGAAALTGKNLDTLQTEASTLLQKIEQDPIWKETAQMIIDEVNQGVSGGRQGTEPGVEPMDPEEGGDLDPATAGVVGGIDG